MAKNSYKSNTFKSRETSPKKSFSLKIGFFKDRRFQLTIGFFLLVVSLFLLVAFVSYLFTGQADQSVVESVQEVGLFQSGLEVDNWMKLWGAIAAHFAIFEWFGIASFLIPPLLFIYGYKVVFRRAILPLNSTTLFVLFFLVWLSLFLGDIVNSTEEPTALSFLSGGIGYDLAIMINGLVGWGTILLLLFSLIVFVIYFFNVTSLLGLKKKVEEGVEDLEQQLSEQFEPMQNPSYDVDLSVDFGDNESDDLLPDEPFIDGIDNEEIDNSENPQQSAISDDFELTIVDKEKNLVKETEEPEDPELIIENEGLNEVKAKKSENYDPTLDLSSYKYPPLTLLNDYSNSHVKVSKEELQLNKNRIVETLTSFNIGISSIKATIGPTVTLYEIVPAVGIKISKIKNLEDDIALSLSALGIRIIAPIPGKGTIGIEVPNKNREMVDIKSVLGTEKFMKSTYELPIVLGKTITNEVYMVDLAKMPHILMAGATGQGKSVGINVILASLIYKKHPSQLKFVLVDPKKVELSLFNKIERHFLAELPGSDEPIITDTKKVVNTLHSLTMEMDARYNLLKDAGTRNIKEYNSKFISRKLNPQNGHRFLPYIVLVIDELADLMIMAGKEIEAPIARLAQLARAIGIHLVLATQRPSVNVITGVIKANFPARLSFRVTSKIDSRTILDTGGADQLVGMGDMLFSQGSDMIRLQCAFIDTPEVEKICEYVGSQRGYETAYLLPEYEGDDTGDKLSVDLDDRDVLFDEAARLIVRHQQGSTSLIQRKMKLGYNRAGRLIDQLEMAGIVGSFEGSKARQVLISDEYSLEQLLNELKSN